MKEAPGKKNASISDRGRAQKKAAQQGDSVLPAGEERPRSIWESPVSTQNPPRPVDGPRGGGWDASLGAGDSRKQQKRFCSYVFLWIVPKLFNCRVWHRPWSRRGLHRPRRASYWRGRDWTPGVGLSTCHSRCLVQGFVFACCLRVHQHCHPRPLSQGMLRSAPRHVVRRADRT